MSGKPLLFLTLLALFGGVSMPTTAATATTFTNPIKSDGADPWVIRHSDGFYYYTQTTSYNITLWRTRDLSDLENAEQKVIWSPVAGSANSEHIWAPELHHINGRWYVYFAASAGDMAKQRMFVLQSEGDDPFGNYGYPQGSELGKISDSSDKWGIDGTVLEQNGQLYYIWSGWEGDVNVRQNLYIAKMENPWTLNSERVEISRPDRDWEQVGTPHINEGPEVLKSPQGQTYIVYSASGSWTDDYKLGMLELRGNDPLDAKSWYKHPEPVFVKNEAAEVFGPGHNGFFTATNGDAWIIHHVAKYKGAGWDREVHMQPFQWNSDGTPNFGQPLGYKEQIKPAK